MARILPLDFKYYGTEVEVNVNGQEYVITVWTPDHFAKPFASAREMGNGYDATEGSHDHVEDVASYKIAQIIEEALSKEGY
jgi:hypothetical protein